MAKKDWILGTFGTNVPFDGSDVEGEMAALRHKNSYPWRVYGSNSRP